MTRSKEKAADLISRLFSIVGSLVETLFLVRSDDRAAAGVGGVETQRAEGQFGGVGHLGYGPLQLQVEVGQALIRLVGTVSRRQNFVADPRAEPDDVIFNHGWRYAVIGIVFIKLRGEFAERVQDAVGDQEL